jgi:DUF4097 and DUF4098 domain-containing protein YvlB
MDSEAIGGVEVPEPLKQKRMPNFEPARQRRSRWPFCLLIGCLLLCCLCLVAPICLLATGVATVASVLENSKVTASGVERVTVDADEIINLDVNNNVGDITIQRGSSDEIVVNYTKIAKSFTKDLARDTLNEISLKVEKPSADRVVISVDQGNDQFFCGNRDDQFVCGSASIDLTISVPEELYLTVTNNVGDIKIENILARDLQVASDTGDIHFDGELGASGSYSLESDTGDLVMVLPGDTFVALDAETSVGDLDLSDFNISVDEERGPGASWQGRLGDGNETPPTLRLKTDTGDITIQRG